MRITLLTVCAVAVLTGVAPAVAADLIVSDEPGMVSAPAPAGFDGFYAGVSLGGAWIGGEIADIDANYSDVGGWQPAETAMGFLAGVQIGYNVSVADSFLIGVEADAKAVFAEDTICSIDDSCGDYNSGDTPALAFNLNGLGAINARIGFNIADNVLLYALAGGAVASVTTHHWDSDEFDGKNRLFGGWDVGIGAEMMVSDNMSVGIEGRYYDFSNDDTWIDAADEEFGASPQVFTVALTANMHF